MASGAGEGNKGRGCSSLGEYMLSIYKTLDPFLKLHHHKKKEGMEGRKTKGTGQVTQ